MKRFGVVAPFGMFGTANSCWSEPEPGTDERIRGTDDWRGLDRRKAIKWLHIGVTYRTCVLVSATATTMST